MSVIDDRRSYKNSLKTFCYFKFQHPVPDVEILDLQYQHFVQCVDILHS